MTYEPWARLRIAEQQDRDTKERRGDPEGFEGYADERCGEETGSEVIMSVLLFEREPQPPRREPIAS
jgi:hypothetical protein